MSSPADRPARTVPSTDGVLVAVHRLAGTGDPLLLAHANGFHGRAFGPLAADLAGRFAGIALDFRGHGDSVVPGGLSYHWAGFSDDVLAVVDGLGLSGCVAVGHSMGGAALLGAEVRRPGTFRGLYCYEPIVFPATLAVAAGAADRQGGDSPMALAAARRRERFDSWDAAIENFASKPPLDVLAPEALRAYVEHGFAPGPGGGIEIKCRAATEAAIYRMAAHNGVFDRLSEVRCPVTVACGAVGDGPGPADFAPAVAAALPQGHLERFEDLGHFGPLQDPPRVADAIARALG